MRVATWNINGVKARMGCMMKWLEDVRPDVVCLQEIKAIDEEFPRMEIEALGYNIETLPRLVETARAGFSSGE